MTRSTRIPLENSRRTSFQPMSVDLTPCIIKEKEQPTPINFEKQLSAFEEMISKTDDLIWILLGSNEATQNKDTKIPGWTGFHHLTGAPVDPQDVSQVVYLPSINCPPTDLKAVNEVLRQVKCKADHLHLESTDLVLDHAIYNKALQILLNPVNEDLRKKVFIRNVYFWLL